MKIFDIIAEADRSVQPGQQTTTQEGGQTQDVNKLAAGISTLQKQIQDLQKAALQQQQTSAQPAQQTPQPKPGEAGQPQASKGTIGSATPSQVGQPMGQQPAQQTQTTQPVKPQIQAPGVNQPPQVTNLKIRQQLAKNVGQGSA
jgi:hypothetical protein